MPDDTIASMYRRCHRADPTLVHELPFWRAGMTLVAGLDEVGRGPLAGPVVAAAVVLPPFFDTARLAGVRDSKALTPRRRAEVVAVIRREALATGVGAASAADVDRHGLTAANRAAMTAALAATGLPCEALLLDAFTLPEQEAPQVGLIHGDALSLSIACASVLAKVERDAIMDRLHQRFPGYGFAEHRGYGTAMHLDALARLGPSPIHRRSFAPVRAASGARGDGTMNDQQ